MLRPKSVTILAIFLYISSIGKEVKMQESKLLRVKFKDCSNKMDILMPSNVTTHLKKLQKGIDDLTAEQESVNKQLKTLIKQLNGTLENKDNTKKPKYLLECDKNLNCISNCYDGYDGPPTTCQQALALAGSLGGVAAIRLPGSSHQLPVCVPCHYNTWMLMQRRKDGSENFNRNWNDYKLGFGNVYGEFWLGLERIHQITKDGNYQLWILFRDSNGNERNAYYETFQVAGEEENYKLTVRDYTGGAGDFLLVSHNEEFTTYDRDNDRWNENCAELHQGGWWFATYQTHLTGLNAKRIIWKGFHGYEEPLKYTHMAIRQKKQTKFKTVL